MNNILCKIISVLLILCITSIAYSQIQITNTTDASSLSNCDGSATASATGTAGPFTFQWSTGNTTATVNQLCQGIHYVTVTNAYECETVLSVNIGVDCDENYSFYLTGTANSACLGSSNGSITGVKAQSNSSLNLSYTYLWNDGSTANNRYNLPSGYYALTVTSYYAGLPRCKESQSFIVPVYCPIISLNNMTTALSLIHIFEPTRPY